MSMSDQEYQQFFRHVSTNLSIDQQFKLFKDEIAFMNERKKLKNQVPMVVIEGTINRREINI